MKYVQKIDNKYFEKEIVTAKTSPLTKTCSQYTRKHLKKVYYILQAVDKEA